MPFFIKLSLQYTNDPIWINIEKIEAIVTNGQDGTLVYVVGDGDSLHRVQQKSEQIFALMPVGVR